ncbi:MAG: TonB-dependent receptor [Cyanobacteria bacterium]|nr:TonB-dependent receptor [Cyanobacteriota bacterium]
MTIVRRIFVLASLAILLGTPLAHAQTTGSITGVVTDSSGAVLPGATITLTSDRLIGGPQTQVSDTSGAYRFDRLVPGVYLVKFELQGFRNVERPDVRISAAFVATINAKMEVGSVAETITVTGESPTVDVRSNLQQTVMNQEILEGIPTGRDPWSLAKLIPGVQVGTYDVGGTQSMQQSSMSAHGSNTSDVSYNIDGATVNWPGGGGGATMMYYDQGMFEEVNYMTSAIPAEIMAGGVSINMVTKDGGNQWKGNLRYNFSNDALQSSNWQDTVDYVRGINPAATFLGNPTKKTYDMNFSGGGALVQNKVWVNGTIRKWVVNKLVNARNADGSQALDDNNLKNYSGKVVAQLTTNNKLAASYLWNDKIRGHRRDSTTQIIPDIASVVQANPVQTTQAKYTGIRGALVFESNFSVMDGETKYTYQPETAPDAIRYVDNVTGEVRNASTRQEFQPNSRHQFDNVMTFGKSGFGGEHLLKTGVQWARLYYSSDFSVMGDHYVEYNSGVPTQVRQFNTPVVSENIARVLGFFVQDSWSMNRLTLNVGGRWDKYVGELPDQQRPGGRFIGPASFPGREVINQSKGVFRLGASYDMTGSGRTAVKASYSRYALQVGIDRVTSVNPLSSGSRTCPWSDPNGDGKFQESEINVAQCSSFSGGATTNFAPGVRWPYSDEATAGVETQLPGAVRVGAMFYYRTNRDQLGDRNNAVPTSAYTQSNITIPNGPGGGPGTTNLQPISVPIWNLPANLASADQTVRSNESHLNTDYKGIEFTATKRFTQKWQMQAGFTIGRNRGGLGGGDLNDPNTIRFPRGIIGNDSERALRISGSYELPYQISLAGSMLANNGYPYVSTYSVTRAFAATQGIALTRASQTIVLSERGTERLPNVTMIDLRLSRRFRFGSRSFQPTIDFFNVTNTDTRDNQNSAVGANYLLPTSILAPRIIRVGFSLNF